MEWQTSPCLSGGEYVRVRETPDDGAFGCSFNLRMIGVGVFFSSLERRFGFMERGADHEEDAVSKHQSY